MRPQETIDMVKNTEKWPCWPLLPLISLIENHGTDKYHGTLVDNKILDKYGPQEYVVYFCTIYDDITATTPHKVYKTPQELAAEWMVD